MKFDLHYDPASSVTSNNSPSFDGSLNFTGLLIYANSYYQLLRSSWTTFQKLITKRKLASINP